MQIASTTATPSASISTKVAAATPRAGDTPLDSAWTNPAAAAALRTSVQMLTMIEDGIAKNMTDVPKIRTYAADLRTTTDTFLVASETLQADASKENDSFLPLISRANSNVAGAESRISSKDFASIWPSERADILGAIRYARMMSDNVAKQLDPTSSR